jgi:hypothetical protein
VAPICQWLTQVATVGKITKAIQENNRRLNCIYDVVNLFYCFLQCDLEVDVPRLHCFSIQSPNQLRENVHTTLIHQFPPVEQSGFCGRGTDQLRPQQHKPFKKTELREKGTEQQQTFVETSNAAHSRALAVVLLLCINNASVTGVKWLAS